MHHFLSMAYKIAWQSDDPHTKLAAVITTPTFDIVGSGVNHLPDGIKKLPERLVRPLKYDVIIHAESDAILNAAKQGNSTDNCIMFATWASCTHCAGAIIQAGIKRLVTHEETRKRSPDRWIDNIRQADEMFAEAGVKVILYDGQIGGFTNLFNSQEWQP